MSAKYLKEHYVYGYYDEQDQIYYVGKGKGKRYKGPHRVEVPPLNRIKILHKNLTDEQACEIETQLINHYGRVDLGTGILENRQDQNFPYSPVAIETLRRKTKKQWNNPNYRKMMSQRQKTRIRKLMANPEWREQFVAYRKTKAYKKLCSKRANQRNQNPEYIKRMAEAKTLKFTGTPFKPKYNPQPTWGNHEKDLSNRRLCVRCGTNYTHSNGPNKFRPRCHPCDVDLGRRKIKSLVLEKSVVAHNH